MQGPGAPFLATDFPRLSFRQPLRRPFGVSLSLSLFAVNNCVDEGSCWQLAANKLLRFGKYVRTY